MFLIYLATLYCLLKSRIISLTGERCAKDLLAGRATIKGRASSLNRHTSSQVMLQWKRHTIRHVGHN